MRGKNGVSIDADLGRRIASLADATSCTPEDILRRAFDEYEAKHHRSTKSPTDESSFDAFQRIGVIGCVKGGPSDVSTNPKYLEGMGRD